MQYWEVNAVGVVFGGDSVLTYQSAGVVEVGQLVEIEIGKKKALGVIRNKVSKPSYKTKDLKAVEPEIVLPPNLLNTADWLSEYYLTPISVVWQTVLPRGVNKSRRSTFELKKTKPTAMPILTAAQKNALKILQDNPVGTSLLHGVTGSGKTMIYIAQAKAMLRAKRSVIVLVPEIGLTAQLISVFSQHLQPVFSIHSRMSESERHLIWDAIRRHDGPCIIIGPRSALFSARQDIGLIVVDEAHEPSFKQDQNPKYSAVRLGAKMAQLHKAQLILGSATPAVEDYHLAQVKKAPIIRLSKTIQESARATIDVIDLKQDKPVAKGWLTQKLKVAMESALVSKKQVMIFHNRRGSAGMSLCENCGWVAECPNCYLPLTLHADWHQLRCHICNHQTKPRSNCPECGHVDVKYRGIGTKQLEADVTKLFPGAIVARFDTDSAKGETLEARYQDLVDGKIHIIVGTQSIAKGLDLPKLRVVAIPLADTGLYLPDYTASERTFQLLYQVAGRVGRHDDKGRVFVQTYTPDHPAIQLAAKRDYMSFMTNELEQRKMALYPPFVFLLKVTGEYASAEAASKALGAWAAEMSAKYSGIKILGPAPAFHERFRDRYRWQIVIKSKSRHTLAKITSDVPQRWLIDIDPSNLL